MFGRRHRKEQQRPHGQLRDLASLVRENDPRGGLQDPAYRKPDPRGPGGTPHDDTQR